jgi:hypothetical protein
VIDRKEFEVPGKNIVNGRMENKGTEGRVYGGDPNLIHIEDGKRGDMGWRIAEHLNRRMRENYTGHRTTEQLVDQKLCPGCYMIAGFNMLLVLAQENGQSPTELARSMRNAFDSLLQNPEQGLTEEIEILLDPCNVTD